MSPAAATRNPRTRLAEGVHRDQRRRCTRGERYPVHRRGITRGRARRGCTGTCAWQRPATVMSPSRISSAPFANPNGAWPSAPSAGAERNAAQHARCTAPKTARSSLNRTSRLAGCTLTSRVSAGDLHGDDAVAVASAGDQPPVRLVDGREQRAVVHQAVVHDEHQAGCATRGARAARRLRRRRRSTRVRRGRAGRAPRVRRSPLESRRAASLPAVRSTIPPVIAARE